MLTTQAPEYTATSQNWLLDRDCIIFLEYMRYRWPTWSSICHRGIITESQVHREPGSSEVETSAIQKGLHVINIV